MKKYTLAPSILSADFAKLGEQIRLIDEAGAQYIHFDVMDGMFVPSISFGLPVLRSIRPLTDRILDVHLMIEEPERYVRDFAEAGADIITVHAEACTHLDRTISQIHETGALAGVALNPATPVSELTYVLPQVDMVLLMSVNPGFGGQKFIAYTIDKLARLSELMYQRETVCDVEVDGGITLDNAEQVMRAGANILVAGSAVFCGDIRENVCSFLEMMS